MGEGAVIVRPAEADERDFRTIYAMLMIEFAEVGRGKLNPEKTGADVYRVMSEGVAYIVERDGAPVGTVGLLLNELWYSDQRFWHEHWLWLAPPERNGAGFRAVLAELTQLANETRLPVQATVFNEQRFKKRCGMARIAEHFMFVPAGTDFTIYPNGEAET